MLTKDPDDTTIRYTIPEEDKDRAFSITFDTILSDEAILAGIHSITNSAQILGADEEVDHPTAEITSAPVQIPPAGERITKTGTILDATSVKWVVTIHTMGRNLENLTMTDYLPAGMTLISGSVFVDGAGISNFAINQNTENAAQQILTVPFQTPHKLVYTVTYVTEASDADLDAGQAATYYPRLHPQGWSCPCRDFTARLCAHRVRRPRHFMERRGKNRKGKERAACERN